MSEESNIALDRRADYELMQRISEGDTIAFEEFNSRFHVLIFATINKVLDRHEDAQDVANEVLTTIWNKAQNYDPSKGSLVTWICTTSRNRAIDLIRSVRRRSALYDRYEENLEIEFPQQRNTGREGLYLSDARRILDSIVVTLSPEQREVIELAFFEGLTQKQIAERLDSPLGTVKARIRRGVEKMRAAIDDKYDDEGKMFLSSL